MAEVVTITGHHRFSKSMMAIKRVRIHAGWTLAPAKKAIDRARHGETANIEVPTQGARDALMADLSELGWSTRSGDLEVDAQAPEPPDWCLQVKGLARVVEHLPVGCDQVRFRLALRDCTIEPEDRVGWVMHENLVLSIGVDAESLVDGSPIAFAGPDDMENVEEDADFRQLYPVGTDLEVFAPSRLNWREDWRLIREKLWNAVSHLATELVDNPEGGSLHRYREYLDHNELGLAYDELLGLADVNPAPDGFQEAMREAALLMQARKPRMKVDPSDSRFQRARQVAASLRPDWSDDKRERALHRALIEKHGLLGVDERILVPWESVMLAAAHLELSVEDPWLVRPLWFALLGEEPVPCGSCGGPCEAKFDRCWGCGDRVCVSRYPERR